MRLAGRGHGNGLERKMNPSDHIIGVLKLNEPPHMVAIQLKILMPVGTAMTIVAAVKYIFVFTSMPMVNM